MTRTSELGEPRDLFFSPPTELEDVAFECALRCVCVCVCVCGCVCVCVAVCVCVWLIFGLGSAYLCYAGLSHALLGRWCVSIGGWGGSIYKEVKGV